MINLTKRPLIMGIFNISENSFYSNSIIKNINTENIEEKIFCCDIIDLGAESTHPGADPISADEEIRLLEPSLKFFRKYDKPISVDTYLSWSRRLNTLVYSQ